MTFTQSHHQLVSKARASKLKWVIRQKYHWWYANEWEVWKPRTRTWALLVDLKNMLGAEGSRSPARSSPSFLPVLWAHALFKFLLRSSLGINYLNKKFSFCQKHNKKCSFSRLTDNTSQKVPRDATIHLGSSPLSGYHRQVMCKSKCQDLLDFMVSPGEPLSKGMLS